MVNTLLRAQGLPEIQRQIAWVPSPQTRGKFVAFTFDSEGKVVPGMGVVANTAQQLDEAFENLTKLPAYQNGYVTRKRDQVTAFMDLYDKAQMDRSEEHTSELQPLMRNSYAVFCLKKKKNT